MTLVAAACTPTDSEPSTTLAATTTTPPTSVAPSTSLPPTTTSPPDDADGVLQPPERGQASTTASNALLEVPGFSETPDPSRVSQDLQIAMENWLIPDFTEAMVAKVYTRTNADADVSVVSVIPTMNWRGDPGFVEALVSFVSDSVPFEVNEDGIFRTIDASGAHIFFWSTGDGFLMTSSINDDDAISYLEQRSRIAKVNEAWSTGTCLFLEDEEGLPYAPFPSEIVVPCDGAHNAEVLLGRTVGTDLVDYDEETIAYDRNFVCDEAYEATFGSQRTNAPTLITYMPDEAEWDRGDRYLACVVAIDRNEGRELIAGPMSEISDLTWSPSPGACLGLGLPADTTSCSGPHAYQYLGDAEVDAESWPSSPASAFEGTCAPLLDDLADGPTDIGVLIFGLGAYAFEQGERTVRCMAFARDEGFLVEVKGSFEGDWTVVMENGVAA